MPQDLVADEKITGLAGEDVVVPTTVGRGCVLGPSVAQAATRDSLEDAYGAFVAAATAVFAEYQPRSGCPAGFTATREAWRRLFPQLTLVRSAFCPRSSRFKSGAVPPCAAPCSTGPGPCIRRRPDGSFRNASAACPPGPAQPSTARWRRGLASGVSTGRISLPPMRARRRRARPPPSIACRRIGSGSCMLCATVTVTGRVPAWPGGRGRCHGSFIPLVPGGATTSQPGRLRLTISLAFSITPTGCRTS